MNLSDLQKAAKTFFINAILNLKSIPQGPFWRIKLYFELESRPAGAFLGKIFDKLRIQVRMQIFEKKKSQSVLNHVLVL